MFKKILLPVDLSDRHGRALEMAADLAARDGGELLLLHVVEEIPGLGRDEDPAFYERLERKATAHLKRLN
ncbi:MAG TPA: universal stress protein, partial [Gemmataceae bacterium]